MIIKKVTSFSVAALLCTVYLQGMGISFGPFDLQLDGGYYENGNDYAPRYRNYNQVPNYQTLIDTPICRAISQQKRLEFIVESKEKINANETKMTTKRVIVEPYAFGFTKDKQPVLRGVVTDEKLVREVTVKLGDQEMNDHQTYKRPDDPRKDDVPYNESTDSRRDFNQGGSENQKSGWFSGLFRSHKSQGNVESLNLSRVSNMRVLDDSHFDAPKDLNTIFKEDIAEVVCQVPPVN